MSTCRLSFCTRRTVAGRRSPSSTRRTTARSGGPPPPSSTVCAPASVPTSIRRRRSRPCSCASPCTALRTNIGRSIRRRSTARSARTGGRRARPSCAAMSRSCSGGRPHAPSVSGRDNSPIDGRRRALLIALGANTAFLAVEVAGGFAFGSLALLADATHMVSDVIGLSIAYAALRIAQRPPTERHTFGFGRTEVLVAQGNALLLFASAVVVIIEAVRRLETPHSIDAVRVLLVGGARLLLKLRSATRLAPHAHRSLHPRRGLLHPLADALRSAAVVGARG